MLTNHSFPIRPLAGKMEAAGIEPARYSLPNHAISRTNTGSGGVCRVPGLEALDQRPSSRPDPGATAQEAR